MVATHLLARTGPDGSPTLTALLADGRSSALFAVLAGVGVALSTGGPHPPVDRREHAPAAAGLALRGVLIALVGLLLGGLGPPVAVILAYYGLLFVAATPLLRLRSGVLAAGAVAACALTPVLSQILRAGLPPGPGEQPGLGALADPADLLVTLGLTGYYPALTWTTYLLAGMAVGRLDLRRVDVAGWLLGGGAALAVAAAATSAVLLRSAPIGAAALAERRYGTTPTDTWWWLAVDLPHSGTPPDLAGTTGSALAVLGLMLLLGRRAPALLWLPAAAGAIPLTAYALHVPAVGAAPDVGVAGWLVHVLVLAALGAVVHLTGRRGPLEALVAAPVRRTRIVMARRHPA
jgi:hypothetical protein